MTPKKLFAERKQIAIASSIVAFMFMVGVGVAFAQAQAVPLASGPYALLTEIQGIGQHLDQIIGKVDKATTCKFTSKTCPLKTPPPAVTPDQTPVDRFPTVPPTPEPLPPAPDPVIPPPTVVLPPIPAPAPLPPPPPPQGFTWIEASTNQIHFSFPPSNYRYDPLGGEWFINSDPYWALHVDKTPPPATTACGSNCAYCRLNCQRQLDICGAGGSCIPQATSCQNTCPTN